MARSTGFITKDIFKAKKEDQNVLKWNELEEGIIYKVTDTETTEGKFGPCSILHIIDKDAKRKRVWGPSQMVKRIVEKQQNQPTTTVYFTSLGQAQKDGKTYNNFDLVFQ